MLLRFGADILLSVWDPKRPRGAYGSGSPEHTVLCLSFRNNEHRPLNEEGRGIKSLLKSRQFLIKTMFIFLPEILRSDVVPCNLSLLPGRTPSLTEKEIHALAFLCVRWGIVWDIVQVNFLGGGEGALLCSICWFSWWKYSHKDCFKLWMWNHPKAELGRDTYSGLWREGGAVAHH